MPLGHVDITLDRPRRLRLDHNALVTVEELIGKPISRIVAGGELGFREIRALVFAGLRHDDRRLTLERVGELLDEYVAQGHDLAHVLDLVTRALEQSGIFNKPKQAEDGQGNAATAAGTPAA